MAGKYLTPEQIAELKVHQRNLHDVLPQIDRAEKSGVNVASLRMILAQQQQTIHDLLQNYGDAS